MVTMIAYDDIRKIYQPTYVKVLLIAESPPPEATVQSSRHFYRNEPRRDDRLFVNTIKALYPEAAEQTEAVIESNKEQWLRRFQADGWYMIEALDETQPHEATKAQRQARIQVNLPKLLKKVTQLANKNTKIILIKSNVFDVAAKPLQEAGFRVLNTRLLDYPGRFNQHAYREKLAQMAQL